MARLFEGNFPYVNQHGANFDWIIKALKELDVKTDELEESLSELTTLVNTINTNVTNITNTVNNLGGRVTALENNTSGLAGRVTALENADVTIIGRIEVIESELADIDLQELSDLINSVNINSINRDNALSARIATLESARVHDVYNYYTDGNLLLFGSDLRNLPSYCKDADGYAIGYGNPHNRTQNQTVIRSFKFTNKGLEPNSESTASYDTFQMGVLDKAMGIVGPFTVSFFVTSATNDNPTGTWYSHTFSNRDELWTLASNVTIKVNDWQSWTEHNGYCAVGLQGSATNWANFLGSGKAIAYMYVEYGTGSVDMSTGSKPKLNCKDRNFFLINNESPTPTLPSPTQYNFHKTASVEATVQIGSSTTTVTGDIEMYFYLWSFNGMLNGNVRCFINSGALKNALESYTAEISASVSITGENLTRAIHQARMKDSDPVKGYLAEIYLANGSDPTDPIETAEFKWISTPIVFDTVIESAGYLMADIPVMNLIYT